MAITTKQNVENYLLVDIDDSFDTQIDDWIKVVTKYMEEVMDRKIIADTLDTDYEYRGNGTDQLLIDDFTSITSVEVDGNTITEYDLLPLNKKPYYYLDLKGYRANKNTKIKIKGKQGYCDSGSIPADLVHSATVLLAGIISVAYLGNRATTSESIGQYSVSYAPDKINDYQEALKTLKRHRRVR